MSKKLIIEQVTNLSHWSQSGNFCDVISWQLMSAVIHRDKISDLYADRNYFAGMSDLASKLGQIGPKWDKSGTL